jgi:D-arabinose 1-dehydrogenase-like Zn-dependent alcohol dehydrogenase
VNGITKDGGYAEYTLLRAEAAVKIPEGLDAAETGPLLCAGVTVFNAMRRQGVAPGSLVAVQGLGGLGHLAVQYATRMGYRVVVLSRGEGKREFAKSLGAEGYVDAAKEDVGKVLQGMGGASMIVSTAPNAEAIKPLVYGLGLQGVLLLLAVSGPVEIDTTPMITYGLRVTSWPSGNALDCEEAIAFAEEKGVKCKVERFPLDKANEAFTKMMTNEVRFRSVIVME